MTRADTIAQTAMSLVGTPFQHAGRQQRVGLDCWGVVSLSLGAAGCQTDPDISYPVGDHGQRMEAELAQHCDPATGDLQPGDFIIVRPRGSWAHIAVVVDHLDGLAVVHAVDRSPSAGVVCELIDGRIAKWIERVWRLKEGD